MSVKRKNIFRMTLMGMFIAVMMVMNFTPIGYITAIGFTITLMTIPVALGAACSGVTGGIVLGAVFGLTSFLQAFGIGAMIDPLAAPLFNESWVAYTITCFIPRILAGLCSAAIFRIFEKKNKVGVPAFLISAGIVPFLNTLLFISSLITFYPDTALGGKTIMTVLISAFSLNFLVEFTITLVAAAIINKVIYTYLVRSFGGIKK